jgi:hypothetical protein
LEDCCWKKKDTKPSNSIANYLEVLVDDGEATLAELNKICGANHHLSSRNKNPKRRLLMQANEVEGIAGQAEGTEAKDRIKKLLDTLKIKLIQAPIFVRLNFERPSILVVNRSIKGVRSILS